MNQNVLDNIINIKGEPDFIKEYRISSFKLFKELELPNFGPKLNINFDSVNYYKKISDEIYNDWDKVDTSIKDTFDNIGLISAEKEYLGGVGAQVESEVIYHNMLSYIEDKGIIFLDTDSAIKKYPEIFKKYFGKLVKNGENKFTALNGTVFSGGTFIYVPKNTVVDRPLQSYFRINSRNMGQFERTLIIVEDNSSLEYIEGCTAPQYNVFSLHAAVVEIYVGKNSKCKYVTIQNWSNDVYNLVTKRAIVDDNGMMEWIDGNVGSAVTMKYPATILKGNGSIGRCISIGVASTKQYQDAGAKMIHIGDNTKSEIISKSICSKGGSANFRGKVEIKETANNSISTIKCDSLILDNISHSDTMPKNVNNNNSSIIEHEATVSKLDDEKLEYLLSRGIDKKKAKELMLMGFISKFRAELPLEYAVELNNLLKDI